MLFEWRVRDRLNEQMREEQCKEFIFDNVLKQIHLGILTFSAGCALRL